VNDVTYESHEKSQNKNATVLKELKENSTNISTRLRNFTILSGLCFL
jgi:hypothetical protein